MTSVFTNHANTERPMSQSMAFSARRNNTATEFCGNNTVICKDTADAVSFVVMNVFVRLILADVIVRLAGIVISRKNGTAYKKKFSF